MSRTRIKKRTKICDMELDEKGRWKAFRREVYEMLTWRLSEDEKKEYEGGVYESPKTYVAGVARNDGSWVKYVHNGNLWCRNKEEIGRYLYGYVCFLLKAGYYNTDDLRFYCLCFLIDKLKYRKGLFGCSPENKKIIDSIIKTVYGKRPANIKSAKPDKREFCIDPKLMEGMTVAEKTRLQKKIQKELTDARIARLYDRELSIRKNVERFKEGGLDISPSRLHQWLKENSLL